MNKITNSAKIIVECMWFAAGILCLFISIREFIDHNTSQVLKFLALTLFAAFYFFYRRKKRLSEK